MSTYILSATDKAFRKAHIRHSAYTRDWDQWRRNMGKQDQPHNIAWYLAHMLRENGRSESQIGKASYVAS